MKTLHVFHNTLPCLAGYTIRGHALMRAQQGHGLQVVALSGPVEQSGKSPVEEIDGVRYYRTTQQSRHKLPGFREFSQKRILEGRLDEVIRLERPDIIHTHSPVQNGLAAAAVATRAGVPFVYEMRALWEEAAADRKKTSRNSLFYRSARWLETRLFHRADSVVTICEGLRREIVSRGVNEAKVFVVANGVEPALFAPTTKDMALCTALGLLDAGPVFGFIGSLFYYEGVEDLLEAMPAVLARFPRARLLIVGGGEREAQVRERLKTINLPQIVYRPRVPHADVPRYYSIVDCLVYPRRRVRLTELVTPLKPLEAMAMAKAVVASDVGGHRELVQHESTGLLYRADNVSDLAAVLCRIAAEPDLAGRIAVNGRNYVLRERTWKAVAANYLPAYDAANRNFRLTDKSRRVILNA